MDKISLLEKFCGEHSIDCMRDMPLAGCCTFKIGGNARLFIIPREESELILLARFSNENDIPVLILGKGSNVLFSDEGFTGAVVHIGSRLSYIELTDETTVFCQSGASLAQLCQFALQNSLSGLEFAYGIPGSVGGAVYMNAGAYGGEIKDVLVRCEHITTEGEKAEFDGGELMLSYRHSAYSGSENIITGAYFRLNKADPSEIKAKMEDFMSRRRDKQPLDYPSAGSTFKRPEGAYASALIDSCGLKGRRTGGAMVSEKHAGFIINRDNATSADVIKLIGIVKDEVKSKTGYELECEVRIIP